MTALGIFQIVAFCVILTALVPLLGGYMARVLSGERVLLVRLFGPMERLLYRGLRTDPEREQTWKGYARSLLTFSVVGWLLLFAILRLQGMLPGNPQGFDGAPWDVTFNTTSSFVSNTNWQFYAGETTLSNFAQMAGLTVQNFLSAAVGIAVLVALIRGITRSGASTIGNFWVDMVRSALYILLPLSFLWSLLLVSQGVVQTMAGSVKAATVAGAEQVIALGPAASQVAIKQLGTNGGGFFNVNSAHPLENSTAFSNIIMLLALLLIPASLVYTYGKLSGRMRQGWAIYGAMMIMFVGGTFAIYASQSQPSPAMKAAGVTAQVQDADQGNLQDSEQRNGVIQSSLYAGATTSASNGSVNSGHESYNGLAAAVVVANMMTGEVIFGGVGSGLYGMLFYVLLAVFLAGLMVGRTPEYAGKKIGGREIKFVMIGTLAPAFVVLSFTALAIATKWGGPSMCGDGIRGFTETLYAYTSQANNNGSAYACFTGFVQPNGPGNEGSFGITFAAMAGGLAMLIGRFLPIIAVLALAGALAAKKTSPEGPGTMRTDTPTFVALIIGTVLLVALLTFVPALLLGPIAEGLTDRLF